MKDGVPDFVGVSDRVGVIDGVPDFVDVRDLVGVTEDVTVRLGVLLAVLDPVGVIVTDGVPVIELVGVSVLVRVAVRVIVELDEADVLPERLIAFVLDAFELGERLWTTVGVS